MFNLGDKNLPHVSCIYSIICLANNKRYIGQTMDFSRRAHDHWKELSNNKHFNKYLQRCFNKYLPSDFKIEILEIIEDLSTLSYREQHYAELYNAFDRDFGFNFGTCVDNPFRGQKHSEETKELLSKLCTGRVFSAERNKRVSEALKGRVRTEKECEAISAGALLAHDKEKKSFKLVSPYGELVEGFGIRPFCKKYKLHRANLTNLIKGRTYQYKGWRLFDENNLDMLIPTTEPFKHKINGEKIRLAKLGKPNPKKWLTVELANQTNEIFTIKNLAEFARNQELPYFGLSELVNGKISEYKGWRVHKIVPKDSFLV